MPWTLRKWAVSAFVAAHLTALVIWNLPGGAIRDRYCDVVACYFLPSGLWQNWSMFAPDPPYSTLTLEALTQDRHGVMRAFAFPRIGERSVWEGAWMYRHAKYANVAGAKDSKAIREYAARTVLRRLDIPDDAYPVDVQLQFQVRTTPPPGTPSDERPLNEPPSIIGSFRFPNRAEVEGP